MNLPLTIGLTWKREATSFRRSGLELPCRSGFGASRVASSCVFTSFLKGKYHYVSLFLVDRENRS